MKYTIVSVITILSAFLAFPPSISAAQTQNCVSIYGGGNSCIQTEPLVINKQIQNPDTDAYVDNLPTDVTYAAEETILFKITVSNSGTAALREVVVKDIFPAHITYYKGEGKYDQKTRTFSFTIAELKSKENKVFFIEGKVDTTDKLPNNAQSTCVINQSEVQDGDKISRDNARLCLAPGTGATKTVAATTVTPAPAKKPVTPTPTKASTTKGGTTIYPPSESKKTPETGPEAVALFGLAPLGALGFYLRNKARQG